MADLIEQVSVSVHAGFPLRSHRTPSPFVLSVAEQSSAKSKHRACVDQRPFDFAPAALRSGRTVCGCSTTLRTNGDARRAANEGHAIIRGGATLRGNGDACVERNPRSGFRHKGTIGPPSSLTRTGSPSPFVPGSRIRSHRFPSPFVLSVAEQSSAKSKHRACAMSGPSTSRLRRYAQGERSAMANRNAGSIGGCGCGHGGIACGGSALRPCPQHGPNQYRITERITLPSCMRSNAWLIRSSGNTALTNSSILNSPAM